MTGQVNWNQAHANLGLDSNKKFIGVGERDHQQILMAAKKDDPTDGFQLKYDVAYGDTAWNIAEGIQKTRAALNDPKAKESITTIIDEIFNKKENKVAFGKTADDLKAGVKLDLTGLVPTSIPKQEVGKPGHPI